MCWGACACVHEASRRAMAPGARLIKKKLFGPPKVLWVFVGPGGFEHVTGTGWWKKLLGPPKVVFFHVPFLSTSLPLFLPHHHPLRPPFSISCCCCWCYEISITDYLVNFKINLGDLAEVALVCSDYIYIYMCVCAHNMCLISHTHIYIYIMIGCA